MRKFGRLASRRRLFVRSLAENLVTRGKVETTLARAKEIRPVVERLVTVAKRGDLAALRLLKGRLSVRGAFRLTHDIAPRYQERRGGYLRITKLAGTRMRDGAPRAVIEFVE